MAQVKSYTITEPYLNLNCALGEAPFWEVDRDSLRFVDVVRKKLHFINLSSGPSSHKQVDLDFSVSTTADIEGIDGEFLFGGKLGYGIFSRESGKIRWIQRMWTDAERQPDDGGKPKAGKNREERMRSNDGAVDSKGRYWVGTMRCWVVSGHNRPKIPDVYTDQLLDDDALVGSNFTDEGIIFRLDNDLSLHRVIQGVTIPNGTSWSLDNKTMYMTDSPSQTIKAYPYDSETGSVATAEGKVLFKTEVGVPDGHCQDEEGCLWVANHGAGKVWRVNPEGEVLAQIDLPTRCVTCPAFCGTSLYITSMKEVDPDNYPESTKYQGALFKIDVGVRGRPLNKFKMSVKA